MRILLLLTIMLFVFSPEVFATTLVISEKNISETIVRDHFSNPITDSFIDHNKLDLLVERIEEQVYESPQNAYLTDTGEIIPAKPGVTLDRRLLLQQFYHFYYSNVSFQIRVPKKIIYPRVDSELLSEITTYELANYTTYFKSGNEERSNNIALATEAINNSVVFPGEKFSFNKVVGKRTKEKGYMRAPVIVKGELSEDIGGGICQVSSTLFNAVNLEGIKIVERYSHSRNVPYVPPGKDATVSWWGPDFVFLNEYNHPILIRATAKNGRVAIRILSSESIEKKNSDKSEEIQS
ncbi:VanW like protein [Oceanobacillus limi]|uniref:VanW like protein n=1 Tax=Oceanobacillus limi TaxID=930131 RepID=A0A1I0D5X1_9BACI|nr:VanW family protein [Oceanobacillus limi]SET27612.1 VanW like protein [Oceanobacillus limi]